MFEVVAVRSGAKSLRALEIGETFHPVLGPMAEATLLHVAPQRLPERAVAGAGPFVIWDVGLGAAGNAVAMLEAAAKVAAPFQLHSFDQTAAALQYALQHALELDYLSPWKVQIGRLIETGQVDVPNPLTDGVIPWHLHLGDFRGQLTRADLPAPAAIMYDPYSPQRNPEMWSETHFTALRRVLKGSGSCLLTSYSRSTAVRVTLLLAGFFVGRGRSIGDKEETTIAATSLEVLEQPLDEKWLPRVSASTNSAPLTDSSRSRRRISGDELERLKAHPQFAR